MWQVGRNLLVAWLIRNTKYLLPGVMRRCLAKKYIQLLGKIYCYGNILKKKYGDGLYYYNKNVEVAENNNAILRKFP